MDGRDEEKWNTYKKFLEQVYERKVKEAVLPRWQVNIIIKHDENNVKRTQQNENKSKKEQRINARGEVNK